MGPPADALARHLLEALAVDDRGLGAIYALLDVVVAELELQSAAVVIGEPPFAGQLFRAGRTLGPEDGLLAMERPGLYAEPPVEATGDVARVFAHACTLALRAFNESPAAASSAPAVNDLHERFEVAAAHAARAGCPFAFVLVEARRAPDGAVLRPHLARHLRRDDAVTVLDETRLALLLPLARGDRVGPLLERAAATPLDDGGVCPAFTYSVVVCPQEAAECDAAVRLARERHRAVTRSLEENHTAAQ